LSSSLAEDMQEPGGSRPRRSGQPGSLQALAFCTFISLMANGSGAGAENIAQSLSDPSALGAIQDPAVRSRAIFSEMARVIESPRCMNCHPATDRPTQGNDRHQHIPFAGRGEGGVGVAGGACRECHGDANFTVQEGASYQSIPGHPRWGLAIIEMAWQGKTPGEICRQLKDPGRNGGRSLELLHEHAANDDLIAWGWHPGAGREPAPGTQELFGRLVQAWIDTGAECP
jgi:hypothetical protein